MKRTVGLIVGILLVILGVVGIVVLCLALRAPKNDESWKNKGFDLSLPVLDENGWYMVFEDDFAGFIRRLPHLCAQVDARILCILH